MLEKLIGKRFDNDEMPSFSYGTSLKQEIATFNYLKDLDDGIFPIEEVACDCGADIDSFEIIAKKDRYGINCQTVICKNCGMVMTNPRMTQEGYNLFYDKYYRLIYTGSDVASDEFFDDQCRHGQIIYSILCDNIEMNKISNVLEIGCGAGGILMPFKENGKKVKGIDLGSSYIKYGIEQGLDLENINSKELLSKGIKYDLIILSHVAEHFLDINSELSCIYDLLADNGKLYIEVPGINSITINGNYNGNILTYLQNAHVRHFSLNSLVQLMSKNGFKLILGDEQIASIFEKGFMTSYSIDNYNDTINSLINMEKKYLEFFQDSESIMYENARLKQEQEYSEIWIDNINNGQLIAPYLIKNKYNQIAIYGNGQLVNLLIMELSKFNFKIDYLITHNTEFKIDYSGYPIYTIHDDLPDTDAIIVVEPFVSTLIRRYLNTKKYIQIIPIGKILLELSK
ncbi:MAG: class I SAM-dependent methyltransferase [Lachnospiraceae bacterium]|nr:class I SAM-dependent methyltransferase [Lachnospiraceae bacterium]